MANEMTSYLMNAVARAADKIISTQQYVNSLKFNYLTEQAKLLAQERQTEAQRTYESDEAELQRAHEFELVKERNRGIADTGLQRSFSPDSLINTAESALSQYTEKDDPEIRKAALTALEVGRRYKQSRTEIPASVFENQLGMLKSSMTAEYQKDTASMYQEMNKEKSQDRLALESAKHAYLIYKMGLEKALEMNDPEYILDNMREIREYMDEFVRKGVFKRTDEYKMFEDLYKQGAKKLVEISGQGNTAKDILETVGVNPLYKGSTDKDNPDTLDINRWFEEYLKSFSEKESQE